jgi:outer membrane protein OmpA-like peptidoglycan-associated protein
MFRILPRQGLLRRPLGVVILLAAIAVQPAWSWKCALIGAAVGGGLGTGIGAIAHSGKGGDVGEGVAIGSSGAVPGFIIGGLLCKEEEKAAPAAEGVGEGVGAVQPIGIVYFDFDKYNIRPDQQPVIDDVASKMSAEPALRVSLEGNTDSIGSEEYNLSLGQRRADSVERALEGKGISTDRMTTKSYGEERPVAPNTNPDGSDNPAGRAKNRRTEIIPIR